MDLEQIEVEIAQRQKLAEAIAELSNLAQPSRAADTIVALALPTFAYGDRPCVFYNAGPYYDGGPDRIGLRFADEEGGHMLPGNAADMLVPEFTSSYDAAMRLIKQDARRRLEFGSNGASDSWAYAHLESDKVGEAEACFNEPTAITVAILQAFAEQLAGEGA